MQLPDFLTRNDDGFIHFTGHRIGLMHLVDRYNDGFSAEMLWHEYPTLPLATIHKAIAFYLENQAEVDAYVAAEHAVIDEQAAAPQRGPTLAELRRRMAQMMQAQAQGH